MNQQNDFDVLVNDLLEDPFQKTEVESLKTMPVVKEKEPQMLTFMERLSPEQQEKARIIAASISTEQQQSILQYGVAAQSELSKFSDMVLDHVRTKDHTSISSTIEKLMEKIYEVNPDELEETKKSFFSRFFKPFSRKVQDMFSKYDRINAEIDSISDELDKHKQNLTKDVMMLQNFYERNKSYFLALNVYIAAGEVKLEELRNVTYPNLERKAKETNDELAFQQLKDLHDFINRLEKRVHDLKLSRQIALQTAPQIRLIQGTNQTLTEKIQSSIVNTIPLWKNQIVLAVAMNQQQKALEAQKQISKTTNELLTRNAEKLKMNTIEAAKENERAMVDVDTLRKVQKDLIDTLQETMAIQEQGKQNRIKAEKELYIMEEELKNLLLDLQKK